MASTYSPSLKLTLMGDGDQSGLWGQTTNTNLGTLVEQAIAGVVSINQVGNYKNNTNIGWLVETVGNVRVGLIGTQGLMTSPDKARIIRNGCGFELSNNEVMGRLATYQEDELRKQAKSAVTAQPSKPSKSESIAVGNAEKPRVPPPTKTAVVKDPAPARSAGAGNVGEPKSPKSNTKSSSNPFD